MKRKLTEVIDDEDLKNELKNIHAVPIDPISKDDFESLLKKVVDRDVKNSAWENDEKK